MNIDDLIQVARNGSNHASSSGGRGAELVVLLKTVKTVITEKDRAKKTAAYRLLETYRPPEVQAVDPKQSTLFPDSTKTPNQYSV
tara:strand:- start:152 stop:406 length:255 start_codon:yes stop_codon:yes gene_type:complete